MKPIEEQTVLLTGATDGIGLIAARKLAQLGAGIILHGRDQEKIDGAFEEIKQQTGRSPATYRSDFSSLASVRQLAEQVLTDHEAIDVLINNAGVLPGKQSQGQRLLSIDGHELCFAVNYIAPFLLTHLLLPALRRAAPSRIVNVSSIAQKRLDFDDIMLEKNYDPFRAYAQSKLALAMFTIDLSEQLQDEGITVNCLHPGSLLDTKMVQESGWTPQGSAESGAEVELYVATSPELDGITGQYFDEKRKAEAHRQAYDSTARDQLRRLGEKLTGIGENS